jgi:putative FmdB family regulatory protein
MRLFDYECSKHGAMEIWVGTDDDPTKQECPECGEILTRVYSTFSVKIGKKVYVPPSLDRKVGTMSEYAWNKYEENKQRK